MQLFLILRLLDELFKIINLFHFALFYFLLVLGHFIEGNDLTKLADSFACFKHISSNRKNYFGLTVSQAKMSRNELNDVKISYNHLKMRTIKYIN